MEGFHPSASTRALEAKLAADEKDADARVISVHACKIIEWRRLAYEARAARTTPSRRPATPPISSEPSVDLRFATA